jgi:protein-S-isoprenylcysteine O-methyltransferase Ste14
MRLAVRNALFTLIVPGAGAVCGPWLILSRGEPNARPVAWAAVALIIGGLLLYGICLWSFAAVGRGTPGPWDAPTRLVAVGPYRWVRNPIYIAAVLVLLGEAWLFMSLAVFVYAMLAAVGCHVFVVLYEEPTLRRRFGAEYEQYERNVRRWIPGAPRWTAPTTSGQAIEHWDFSQPSREGE